MLAHQKEKTPAQLKEFGEVMALACLVFAGIGILKAHHIPTAGYVLLTLAAAFLLTAFFSPAVLRPVEEKWMAFAERLSVIATFVILVLTFFFIITPMGLLLRLLRKDLLQLKLDKTALSYWQPADHAGSGSRHYLPY